MRMTLPVNDGISLVGSKETPSSFREPKSETRAIFLGWAMVGLRAGEMRMSHKVEKCGGES